MTESEKNGISRKSVHWHCHSLSGMAGVIIACTVPQWKVTPFTGTNIVTTQVIWEGIWMTCAVQSSGQIQCKVYSSMLALSTDLQSARAMIIVSILAGVFGILMSIACGKCTNCTEDTRTKSMACITAGLSFIIAGVLCAIPVSLTAHSIVKDFYNPILMNAQQRDLEASLYIGWAAAGLLLVGGVLFCLNCTRREQHIYSSKYSTARLTPISREYV